MSEFGIEVEMTISEVSQLIDLLLGNFRILNKPRSGEARYILEIKAMSPMSRDNDVTKKISIRRFNGEVPEKGLLFS
jgi:hypothetical protein